MSHHLRESIQHLVHTTEQALTEIKQSDRHDAQKASSYQDEKIPNSGAESASATSHILTEVHFKLLEDLRRLERVADQFENSAEPTSPPSQRSMIIDSLFNDANTLSLLLHLGATTRNELSMHDIQKIQCRLQRSSRLLCDQALLWSEPRSWSGSYGNLTFKIEEAEVATFTSLPPRRKFVVVCPVASFSTANSDTRNSHEFRFACHCPNVDHKSLLLYKNVGIRSIPVKVTDNSSFSVWEMFLHKTDAVVTLRLSDLSPMHFDHLEVLSGRMAQRACKSTVPVHSNEVLTYREKMASVLRAKTTTELSALHILSIEFFLTNTTHSKTFFKVPWIPKYLQLFQYATMEGELSAAVTKTHGDTAFLDEPHFFIFLSKQHPMSRGGDKSPLELFKIQVYRETVLKYSNTSREIIILDVDCIQDGECSGSLRCSEVHFEFSAVAGAMTFLQSVNNMQKRLLENSLQKALKGEHVVFRCASDASITESSGLPAIFTTVVYNPLASGNKYRLIGLRGDKTGFACCELDSLFQDGHSEWSADTLPSQFVWTGHREKSGRTVVQKQEWDKIDTQFESGNLTSHSGSGPALTRGHESSSSRWFDEIDHVSVVLRAPKDLAARDRRYRSVKIAVIDTGFSDDARHKARRRIIRYKDFVAAEKARDRKGIKDKASLGVKDDPLDSMKDLTGHGTTSVELILRVYKDAELYVARIFKTDSTDAEMEQYLMADAIIWATRHEVDIISISAGFQEGLPELHRAVSKAVKNDTLIFASAANWSYADRAAVPARLRHVFCIFSTDAGCKNSRTYNPPALENDHNFAILGEDVVVAPGREPVNGTSASTAIAAGFAARIVDFTRQPECRTAIEALVDPETESGMTAILKALAVKDGDYECLRPLKILEQGGKFDPLGDPVVYRTRVIDFLRRILRDAL